MQILLLDYVVFNNFLKIITIGLNTVLSQSLKYFTFSVNFMCLQVRYLTFLGLKR
jgi:hypothetical protein